MTVRRSINRFSIIAACTLFLLVGGCLSSEEEETAQDPNAGQGSGNTAPSIQGVPASGITIGQVYTFVPSASDPDGDRLSFSIRNMPDWATFDSSTGELSGQPQSGSEGTYPDIEISVSDGTTATALNSFSITVTQSSLGTATLSLIAPETNTDGTPFTDLASFRIYFGMSSGRYPNMIQVDNPGISTYVVENLAPASYYFVATAINAAGTESSFSNEVTRNVE